MATKSLRPASGDWQIARRPEAGDPLFRLHREVDRLFDDMIRGFGAPMFGPSAEHAATITPSVDISESDDSLKICVDLPGLEEKDIDITLDQELLTIRGERKAESEDKQQGYHVMERSYGSFMRSFRLPFAADPEKIEAALRNGVLIVTVPKPPETQQRSRRIAVKGEAAAGKQPSSARQGSGQAARQPQPEPAGTRK